MKKVILNFKDNSKLHIGKNLEEYISSDRIYSMIINALSYVIEEEELEEIIKDINDKVKISSAFLGIRINDKEIDFIPKPCVLIRPREVSKEIEEKNIENRKKYKKISWISLKAYENISLNYDACYEFSDYSFDKGTVFGKQYYIEDDELDEQEKAMIQNYTPIKSDIMQRNVIDRYSRESLNTYYESVKRISYYKSNMVSIEPYFYFYVDDKENVLNNEYLKCLEFISLGGKRSLGAGIVENVKVIDNIKLSSCNSYLYVNLSMIYPKDDEEELRKIEKYNLEERNGFIFFKKAINEKKSTIRMIKEGSIFNGKIEGNIFQYTSKILSHPVYVYGKAFLIPFGGEK